MLTDESRILLQAEGWAREGRGAALATVVETFGSAPRPLGSHLVVDESGAFFGSVSGGCVEADVVIAALDAIESGAPRLLKFGVADETAWRAGLPCGGVISVHIEKLGPAHADLLAAMREEHGSRRACLLATALDGGAPTFLRRDSGGPPALLESLARGGSGIVEIEGERIFAYVHRPPTRLVIVGAVHVGQALAPMGRLAGFDVAIIDPRAAFAAPERFPGMTLIASWPEEALPMLGLDRFTAVAALSHNPRIDDAALRVALASECFYVGALGSVASHARRMERLAAQGVDARALGRLHAPIGLDIGALSPAEIAVAIMAEIVMAQQRKPLRAEAQTRG
ncbi:XdhC family protein [Methylocystis heyeri]|uniref:XdhC/CoxI family protein n=1 Tax=Methylocystis heyeri TaxID=391905 RepID=A0A6B8KH25_9HYPH|nr:XdhC/CoxI family protein [Methylocystis heyeri]QGM45783.1 XdhC/CoxI family protein [Methylocystis heyeri]